MLLNNWIKAEELFRTRFGDKRGIQRLLFAKYLTYSQLHIKPDKSITDLTHNQNKLLKRNLKKQYGVQHDGKT